MFCLVLVFNNQTVMEINSNWTSSPKAKWLIPAPSPVSTWKSLEEEVLGWAGYLDELSSWGSRW